MTANTTGSIGIAGTRLVQAGVDWDAIKISRFYALQAMERLANPGSVAVDPAMAEPVLYFFTPPGSTATWTEPHSIALGAATYVVLPASHRTEPPGPYWLVPPMNGTVQTTPIQQLRRALELARTPAPEPAP